MNTTVAVSRPAKLAADPYSGTVAIGIGGGRRNTAAAIARSGRLLAFCEEERITRVRHAALGQRSLPDGAVSALLAMTHTRQDHVVTYAVGEEDVTLPVGLPTQRFGHHHAHALAAYFTSSFEDAAILVCDSSAEQLSVWRGSRERVTSIHWPVSIDGLAAIYSECAELFGFGPLQVHRLEGLARIAEPPNGDRLSRFFGYADGCFKINPRWKACVMDWLGADGPRWSHERAARVAAAFQQEIARILLEIVADVRRETGSRNLCLAGGLFYNTFFNTAIAMSGVFDETFVAPNPGNTGLAAGVALESSRRDAAKPMGVSPFLGPAFSDEEIKVTLDNCKLQYGYCSDRELIDQVVDALIKGRLVGWFQGPMEWGHRALGNRSILASPYAQYALENLNAFLKHRPMYASYGVSVCADHASEEFHGPRASTWMEYDFGVRQPERLRFVLPTGTTTLRVQTVGDSAGLFYQLHKAFAAATGQAAVLVNTSFNGFSEPIVCSPRDAIRVFFGTGLDLLAIGRFVLRK